MFDKVIFHIDVNSAFLSWEAVYRMEVLGGKVDLRKKVCAVGGDVASRRGIILAKSIGAKKYGVRTGESILEARKKCPNLELVPANYPLYQRCSQAFLKILREYSPCVEQYSIDEAFVDMTGTRCLWGEPRQAAKKMKDRIRQELGFTVNIGISSNKLLAKMASDFEKPDKVHTLFVSEIQEKMWPLPVSELFFVGRATEKKLDTLGIHTIGDLAETDLQILRKHLKKHGEVIWSFANGKDVSLVEEEPPQMKGYGNSTTIPFDVTDASTAKMILLSLAETVASRLRRDGRKAEVISVQIKDFQLCTVSHQKTMEFATDITSEIHRAACELFEELWNGQPIRLLGIHTSHLRDQQEARQLNLFDRSDYEKQERLDAAIDRIRERYGVYSVKRAVFVESPIDHMCGRATREKRKVDYSKIHIE